MFVSTNDMAENFEEESVADGQFSSRWKSKYPRSLQTRILHGSTCDNLSQFVQHDKIGEPKTIKPITTTCSGSSHESLFPTMGPIGDFADNNMKEDLVFRRANRLELEMPSIPLAGAFIPPEVDYGININMGISSDMNPESISRKDEAVCLEEEKEKIKPMEQTFLVDNNVEPLVVSTKQQQVDSSHPKNFVVERDVYDSSTKVERMKRKLDAEVKSVEFNFTDSNISKRLKNLQGNVLKVSHNITPDWVENLRKRVWKHTHTKISDMTSVIAKSRKGENFAVTPQHCSSSQIFFSEAAQATPAEKIFDEGLLRSLANRSLSMKETKELREKERDDKAAKLKINSEKSSEKLGIKHNILSENLGTSFVPKTIETNNLMVTSGAASSTFETSTLTATRFNTQTSFVSNSNGSSISNPAANNTEILSSQLPISQGVSNVAEEKQGINVALVDSSKPSFTEPFLSAFGSTPAATHNVKPEENIFVLNFTSGKKKKKGRGR